MLVLVASFDSSSKYNPKSCPSILIVSLNHELKFSIIALTIEIRLNCPIKKRTNDFGDKTARLMKLIMVKCDEKKREKGKEIEVWVGAGV